VVGLAFRWYYLGQTKSQVQILHRVKLVIAGEYK